MGENSNNLSLLKRWWRVGCSLHVDEALHCHDLGRLVPRTTTHHDAESLPAFNFSFLYLEEDRTESSFDPYGNVRFYIEFHKFLSYYGTHLRMYLIDEFVENTRSISRLLVTKRSPATLPLSLKKIDFNSASGHLFQNQVKIVNPEGESETLEHYLHVIVESTDDVSRWLYLHCVRRPVCHRPNRKESLDPNNSAEDSKSTHSVSPVSYSDQLSVDSFPSKSRMRRSSIAFGNSPTFRDTLFDGTSCYLAYHERRSCPAPYTEERTKAYLEKVRKGFFRQMDLDFVI